MAKTVNFLGFSCTVEKQQYLTKETRLQLFSDLGPVATATVCLTEYGIVAPANHCYIKNYSENTGILEALIEAGIVEDTGKVVTFGSYQTQAHLCRLLI